MLTLFGFFCWLEMPVITRSIFVNQKQPKNCFAAPAVHSSKSAYPAFDADVQFFSPGRLFTEDLFNKLDALSMLIQRTQFHSLNRGIKFVKIYRILAVKSSRMPDVIHQNSKWSEKNQTSYLYKWTNSKPLPLFKTANEAVFITPWLYMIFTNS